MNSIIPLIIAGAAGAFVKDVLKNGKITLPKRVNSDLALGFVGSIIIGAFVGFIVDEDPVTAGMAGYIGKSAIENLIPRESYHRKKKKKK